MIQALTNDDYYNILLQGYNEALAIYEAKEFLNTDEGMSNCEVSGEVGYSDEFKSQLGEVLNKDLKGDFYFHKEVTSYFLNFLDRQYSTLEKQESIERSYFYKRCLLSLDVKLFEYNKEGDRILRGLNDMETPPNPIEFFEYYKHHFVKRSQQIEIIKSLGEPILKKDYKKQKPFLIGLKFATGEAQELYKKYKGKESFDKLTIDLGFKKSDRTYFSSTLNNIKDGDKNLYNKDKLIMQIYNHCFENEMPMCDEFLKKYNEIESK